jgi:SAM-dependent methyltransferase
VTRADVGGALREAEDRLRAAGLTGSRAFDALLEGLQARLGASTEASALALSATAEVPLSGDLLGLAYERFFPELFKGSRGQYFTPPPIVRLLLAVAGVGPGDDVLDPTCGGGGLLRAAADLGASVRGVEIDPYLAELARINLQLGGIVAPDVRCEDWFTSSAAPAGFVVANPPFSVAITAPTVLARYALARGKRRVSSEVLFAESLERAVVAGGVVAIVIPWSILHNPRYAPVRSRLAAAFEPLASVALPEGVFRPFGGAAGRAALLWMRRRPCAPPRAVRFASLVDPGYDPRSVHIRTTSNGEIDALIAGSGWTDHPPGTWSPVERRGEGTTVGDLARIRAGRVSGEVALVELADADRATGEVRPRMASSGARPALKAEDVLVSRMRPELGNVAIAPTATRPLAASPEWIALDAGSDARYLFHALRSPSFRAALPPTTGQTRPRTTAESVLAAPVRYPGKDVAERISAISRAITDERARLGVALASLQAAIDSWEAGELDADALEAILAACSPESPRPRP